MQFIHRSHISQDMAVASFSPGLFGSLGWSSGTAKLVGWPLQLKSGTAADFTCKLCLQNKTQRRFYLACMGECLAHWGGPLALPSWLAGPYN